MGTVFRRRGRSGKPLRNYSISYFDATGKRVLQSSGTSDKRAAKRILSEREAEVALIRAGVVDPLQEQYRAEANKPAREHLEDYLAACRGRQAEHGLRQKERHLRWLLDVTAAVKLTDIRADVVDARLAGLTEQGKAARTINLKLECARSFLNWAVRNGRLRTNPLGAVPRRNQVLDRRVERRALTTDETRALLAVAREQAAARSEAAMRPLYYLFALLAGFRRGDLERVRWGDIDLEARVVTIKGGKAKKRVDRLPLHPELVEEILRVKPSNVMPMARVFPHPVANVTRQRDFEMAGIPLRNDRDEQADLHALRVTYGTRLALSGVLPAVHQRLMRHATVEQTMRYYTKLGMHDLEAHGMDLLPRLEGGPVQAEPPQAAS